MEKTIDAILIGTGALLIGSGLYLAFAPDNEGLNVLQKVAATTKLSDAFQYLAQMVAAKSEIVGGWYLIYNCFERK